MGHSTADLSYGLPGILSRDEAIRRLVAIMTRDGNHSRDEALCRYRDISHVEAMRALVEASMMPNVGSPDDDLVRQLRAIETGGPNPRYSVPMPEDCDTVVDRISARSREAGEPHCTDPHVGAVRRLAILVTEIERLAAYAERIETPVQRPAGDMSPWQSGADLRCAYDAYRRTVLNGLDRVRALIADADPREE